MNRGSCSSIRCIECLIWTSGAFVIRCHMEFSNTSIDMRDLKPFMDVSHFLMMNETQFFKI
jgi:hypothetical protein